MPCSRYDTGGNWYKGNTHIHSTHSDGGATPEELGRMYAAAGYHFLYRTDHWVASDVAADSFDSPLLWMDGIELDGTDHTGALYHVVCLGTFRGIECGMELEAGIEAARAQGGLVILAHPFWSGNTFADALRWKFDGVEVYNNMCGWLNGKADSSAYCTPCSRARRPCSAWPATTPTCVRNIPSGTAAGL